MALSLRMALLRAHLALPQSVPQMSRSQWRWELALIAAAAVLLAVAFAALTLFLFRRRSRDLTLIYFSVFCFLYGGRLLVFCRSFRSLFDEPETFWAYLNWVITCTINLPCGFFFYQVMDRKGQRLFRWLLAVQIAFVIFGVIAAAFGTRLTTLFALNNVVVLGTLVAAPLWLAGRLAASSTKGASDEIRVFLGGALVWMLFVLHANLLGLGILKGRNVEFLGFLVFVGCLGYISARRALASEERLLSISKELEIAQRIQSSILPQTVPALAGLVIEARYVPMSAVAGDFYDFLPVDDRRVGILVADVTGHGVPAALIASMLKVAFAGQAAHAHDPARVLSGLNRALCGKFAEHFVTAAYLFTDLQAGILRYAAAGHPPFLLVSRESGQVREIESNGLMLGLFPEAEYCFAEMPITTGNRGLLYTDGLLEARSASDEEFGKSRCEESLKAGANLAPAAFADSLLQEVAAFSGHSSGRPREDDITLVVLDFATRSEM